MLYFEYFEWSQSQSHLSQQSALPHFVWQHYLHPSGRELYSMVKLPYQFKNQRENGMVEEPSHLKQLSFNHVCKIGLSVRQSSIRVHQSSGYYCAACCLAGLGSTFSTGPLLDDEHSLDTILLHLFTKYVHTCNGGQSYFVC